MLATADDPIAIIGVAFRFPGDLSDEGALWQSLKDGRDLVGSVGRDRWAVGELAHPKRSEPGRSVTFSAGVLSRVEEFDAAFFGISPREAAWLDPQQRMLLELAWEAMENAGQVPSRLAGSDVAVYVGISGLDYGVSGLDDLAAMTSHTMTGNTLSIAANRLSYVFDLRGPSLAVDTACSSSLVALHHACNSLRSGEASAALVGGVSLLMHPYPFVGFSKASMLSASGRCRAFDASGDGYVRAEGGAVLLLKPLGRALAEGDDIQALILGTGVNSDGSRKGGLTIPSSDAQAELMQSVLRHASVAAHNVDFIEAHGTGTPVGDPVEAQAIGRVFGQSRPRHDPLPIGSVKTNLGHLEPASGMAGLVKAIMAMKHRALPPSLHFESPNPNIDFAGLNLEVVTSLRPLEAAGDRALVAGVNSFGFGGANAHVLLQEYRRAHHNQPEGTCNAPLFLSARTPRALRENAARYATLLAQDPGANLYDVAYAAAFKRERFEKRLALRAADAGEAAAVLARFAQGENIASVLLEDGLAVPGGIAFIYSGNGAQWIGMAQRLLAESAEFGEVLAGLDARIRAAAGFSILHELCADEGSSRLDDTAIAQPLLFAIQVGLTTMLRARGIQPQAVAGHSVGEVAAAWAAGLLDLDQATEVICARSVAQAATRGKGRMAAVALSESAARELLASGRHADVEIAGVNSPNNVTLSGSVQDLEQLRQALEPRGIFFRLLDLDYAFHSRHMDPIRGMLEERFGHHATPHLNEVAYVSSVTGDVLRQGRLPPDYWWRNVREPVRFAQAVSTLVAQGCRVFVEIGPHPILQRYLTECLAHHGVQGRVLDTLRRNDDALARLEETALRIDMLREPAQLGAHFPRAGNPVRLPTYPWQREHYPRPGTSEGYRLTSWHRVHPLLGWRLKDAQAAWENVLDPETLPWLADHKVGGAIVLPGAAYVEMALAAAREWFGGERFELEDLDIVAPVVFDGEHARTLRLELSPRDGSFQIRSRQRLSEDDWVLNAAGRLLRAGACAGDSGSQRVSLQPASDGVAVDRETHYRLASAIGLEYGVAFQRLEQAHIRGETLAATVTVPGAEGEGAYFLQPAVLDACFQSLVEFFREEIEADRGVPFLPVRAGRVRYYHRAPVTRFRSRLLRRNARSVVAEFELEDAVGGLVARLSNCRFRAAALQRRAVPACWRIEAELRPHPADQVEVEFPETSALVQRAHSWLMGEEARLNRAAYFREALPLFEALAVSFAYEAFKEFSAVKEGWLQQAMTDPRTVGRDGVPQPFIQWLAKGLRDEALLVHDDGGWRLEPADLPAASDIWNALLRDFPACLPELVVMGRVGRNLPELLAGELAADAFLKSLRNSHPAQMLYADAPSYLGDRLAVEQILQGLAQRLPSNRRLRVLEVGEGNGELPRQLAGLPCRDQLDYVLAKADKADCERLRAEFQGHAYMSVAELGSEELDLACDTPLPAMFDVVIIRHWLHAARNPMATLTAALRKLAAGGVLLLAERRSDLAVDFMNGLDPQWWHEAKAGDPVSCLSPPSAWQDVLEKQGFCEVEVLTEPAAGTLAEGSYVLLAKRPAGHASEREPAMQSWLVLSDGDRPSGEQASLLRTHLESRGQRVVAAAMCDEENHENGVLPACRPLDPASVARLVQAAQSHMGGIDHIVYFAGWGALDRALENSSPSDQDIGIALFHLARALAELGGVRPTLRLVTRGGALVSGAVGERENHPFSSALWGLGRVIMNEYPDLGCTLIDVACDPSSARLAERLEHELLFPDQEREVVLCAKERYGLRMRRADPLETAGGEPAARFRLDFRVPGQLRNLAWERSAERALKDEEIEVRAMAAGLNFRDVMYTMGLLPDEAVENGFAGASIGLEFSGVVTRIGKCVRDFAPGDSVLGFGPACFASHVVTKASAVAHKPAEWTFEEASTVPTAFFTAYYALKHLAKVQPGERVLIHGAAGGVGIAAVQLAQHLGAEIFATAGSDEKRDFIRLLGADHVFDSRSLDFAEQISTLTAGEGVDVVLNSLAGEAIRRSLRVLKPFGRFLELGKRDFFENTPIGLRPFKDNISYFGIDADQLLLARPELAAKLFRELMSLFREGVLSPLPYRAFPASSVVDAFRTMQQSRHIGKVVVTLDRAQVVFNEARAPSPAPRFRKDATYLITGGLSGFGLESARRLAQEGAAHLALLGRRGMETPGAAEAVRHLRAMGANVTVFACDVSDRVAVQSVLETIRRDMPPLKGILHAAMVLDDDLIANLDMKRFKNVMGPKAVGARHLHELTLDIPLDHFILYSSVTTLIGNPGQASYVAANGYLEGLTNLRLNLGLPATCIAWGPIADAGYLARNEAIRDGLKARLGAAPLTAKRALDMLEELVACDAGNVAVADLDWRALAKRLPSAGISRFERLRREAGASSDAGEQGMDFAALILGQSPEKVHRIVRELVTQEVANILGISADRIDTSRPLTDLGMDSLMGIELALALEQRFGVRLPAMMLNEGPTVERVTVRIVGKVTNRDAEEAMEDHDLNGYASLLAAQHATDASADEVAQVVAEIQTNRKTGTRP